ncbi:MAG: hypothetical protein E7282_01010 [Lachnospiraceae bacterium]|nr:hypothetical protein [Lachnospiraceae bacterium]
MRLPKIPTLLESLRAVDWHLTVFGLDYNGHYYRIIFEDMLYFPHPDEFMAKLTFIKDDENSSELEVFANEERFDISLYTFAEYFEIQRGSEYADFIKSFYDILTIQMPSSFRPIQKEDRERVLQTIEQYEPSNGRCCYDARRSLIPNSDTEYKVRSVFNTEKTKLLRPELFKKVGKDKHISFYYRENDELSDNEIIDKLKTRYGFELK